MPGPEVLKKVGIFMDLDDEELKRVAALCKEQNYQPGDIIIEEDKPGEALYILQSGTARVVKMEGGTERSIAEVGSGEHVGEMSLIDGMTTSARVVAQEPSECLVLLKEDLDLLLASDDKMCIRVLRAITKTLAERLRRTSEDLMVWKLEFNEEF